MRAPVRDNFRSAVELVLSNQFVAHSREENAQIFHVHKGSGMGLVASGEISDITFFSMVEKDFILCDKIREQYEIMGYYRFKDDILLMVGGTAKTRRDLIFQMRERSKFFILEVESVSPEAAPMLDVLITKVEDPDSEYSSLAVSLYQKPTSIKTTLSSTSMHPTAVHRSWPRAQQLRFSRLSGSNEEFKALMSEFEHQLRFNDGLLPSSRVSIPRPVSENAVEMWLVLPFHHAWSDVNWHSLIRRVVAQSSPFFDTMRHDESADSVVMGLRCTTPV